MESYWNQSCGRRKFIRWGFLSSYNSALKWWFNIAVITRYIAHNNAYIHTPSTVTHCSQCAIENTTIVITGIGCERKLMKLSITFSLALPKVSSFPIDVLETVVVPQTGWTLEMSLLPFSEMKNFSDEQFPGWKQWILWT